MQGARPLDWGSGGLCPQPLPLPPPQAAMCQMKFDRAIGSSSKLSRLALRFLQECIGNLYVYHSAMTSQNALMLSPCLSLRSQFMTWQNESDIQKLFLPRIYEAAGDTRKNKCCSCL